MRYNPEAAVELLQPGTYSAVVKAAKEKVSKNGNAMIELILTCYGHGAQRVDVFDYLLSSDDWQWKVRHFCESAGIDYGRGNLEATECLDKNVSVTLGVEKQEGYAEKNRVTDYGPRSNGEPQATIDDDVPF